MGGNIFHQAVALFISQEDIATTPGAVHELQGNQLVGEDRITQYHFVDSIAFLSDVFRLAFHNPGGGRTERI